MANFLVHVMKVTGDCKPGYKEGDSFHFSGLKTPEHGFCGGAYAAMFPSLFALNFGGEVPNGGSPGKAMVSCPDNGICKFQIERLPEKEALEQTDGNKKVMAALKHIGVETDLIHPQAQLNSDLHIDSTEAVELVAAIKRHTGVVIAASWCKCKTVQDLVDYIESKV
jgi:acyl carrier protein